MNNNCLPTSQNISNSGIEYPYQYAQNLNYYFYIMPDKSLMPGLNYYQVVPLSYIQNTSQPVLMNINNDNNEPPILYNYNYNNIYPLINTFGYTGPFIPQQNTQLNYEQSCPAPVSNDLSFLNKKRNSSTANKKEKEKEKEHKSVTVTKKEEEIKHLNDNVKPIDKENLENNDTIIISHEENIIKDIKSDVKEVIQKEIKEIKENESKKENENKKDIIVPSTASTSPNIDKNNKDINNNKTEKKKGKKKKKNYAELLHDTILEHIGEKKKKVTSSIENNSSEIESKNNRTKNDIKNKNKNKIKNKNKDTPTENNIELDEKTMENTDIKDKTKDKNKKSKIKNKRNQKKKQHKITIKNNKDILADLNKDKNEINPKFTKVIFHGEDYKNTKSTIDFMKYNFDFRIEEQYKTKKLITDYDQQHIDLTRINQKLYENYNSNSQNIKEIEQKWSRKQFIGDDKELKKVISIIKDSFPGRKIDVNEEKYLNILKKNHYNIQEFLDCRHAN